MIPQIVARTREITRAVVKVKGKDIESVQVGVDTEILTREKPSGRRFTLTETDFFDILSQRVDSDDVGFAHSIIEDMQALGCIIEWKQGSFVVKLPDPAGSGQKLSMLIVPTDGRTHLRGELLGQLRSIGLPQKIAIDYTRESSQLFNNCQESEKYPGCWSRPVDLKELRSRYTEFLSILEKTISRVRQASQQTTAG